MKKIKLPTLPKPLTYPDLLLISSDYTLTKIRMGKIKRQLCSLLVDIENSEMALSESHKRIQFYVERNTPTPGRSGSR